MCDAVFIQANDATGDIAALKTLRDLQVLLLANTQVSGDIAALKTLAHLQHLHLGNAQVTGECRNHDFGFEVSKGVGLANFKRFGLSQEKRHIYDIC